MTQTEELLIRMGFDASAVSRGTQAMVSAQRTAASHVKEIWQDVGRHILGFLSVGAVIGGIEKAFSRVKEIQAGAAKTGLSTSSFQQLSQIANEELPDGAAKFDAAITKLNVNIGQGAKEFEKWGIHSRAANEAIYEIADRMHQMTDPAEKAAMAVDLMGKSGASMVPLLERGASALREMGSHKSIFTDDDLENIKSAHHQIEEMQNRVTIWAGKFISAIANGSKMLGELSVPGGMAADSKAEAHEWMEKLKSASEARSKLWMQGLNAQDDADATAKKAESERLSALAQWDQKESAKERAEAEKKAKEQQAEALDINQRLQSLYREQANLEKSAANIDRETPTIADLAGRGYTSRLDKLYGAGGRFDTSAGDGPFAKAAQDYELAKKQQMWDIVHGNAKFNDDGKLIGGDAFEDQKRQISAHNLLKGAGLETPEMQMADMRKHLSDINDNISKLLTKADGDGIWTQIKIPGEN